MFNGQGACAEYVGQNPNSGSVPGAAGSPSSVAVMPVGGRERPLALVNPYRPIIAAGGAPVSGMNAFPCNTLRDRRYYGLAGSRGHGRRIRIPRTFVNADKGFSPMGLLDPSLFLDGATKSGGWIETATPAPNKISTTLQSVLDAIRVTLPATISAVKGQPYYNPAALQPTIYGQPATSYVQPGYAGPGSSIGATAGSALGGLGDTIGQIVTEHPYLVMAGGAALLLLFMNPPRRR